MGEYYVYKHIRLKDGSTFYIGKGKGARFSSEVCGRSTATTHFWKHICK